MGWMSAPLSPSWPQRLGHHLKFGRADIGAIGVAEEQQHGLSGEALLGDGLTLLVHHGEGPADQRLAGGCADPAESDIRA